MCKPEKELTPLKVHMNHQQCRGTLPSHALSYAAPTQQRKPFMWTHWCKAHTCASTHVHNVWHQRHMARCPVISRSALQPRCQKEDSPHLDLVWVSRAVMGPCRFSPRLYERGRADVEGGGKEGWRQNWIHKKSKKELSYGLGNFNDIVCEKIFRGNCIIIEKHRVQFYCITRQ